MNLFRLSAPQKIRIAETLQLRKGITMADVLREIEKAARRYLQDYYDNESAWKTLDSDLNYTPWRKRGKVKKRALHRFLAAVILIYRDATGGWLGRKNWARYSKTAPSSSREDRQREVPPPFILACLSVLPHRRYTPRILQNVLKGKDEQADVLYIDDDVNVDWLHPNAKQFLAAEKKARKRENQER